MGKRVLAMVRPMSAERVGGIARYAREHGWNLVIQDRFGVIPLSWENDGMVVTLRDDPALVGSLRRLMALGVPAVDLTIDRPDVAMPRVISDHEGIGRLAAAHFAERNYAHLAWFSTGWGNVHALRYRGFSSAAPAERWVLSREIPAASLGSSAAYLEWIGEKLRAAPKPLAVLTYDEADAATLLYATGRFGLAVPEEVAILSIGDNRLVCESQPVPLSSIDQNLDRAGYEAAALLDGLMSGGRGPKSPILVPPAGITLRRSSDAVAVSDPLVRAALGYIADHLSTSFGVAQIARALGTTANVLHNRFMAELGHPVGAEISRQRIAMAKRLLLETGMPAQDVANAAGFCSPSHLSNAFRAATGLAPRAWRLKYGKA